MSLLNKLTIKNLKLNKKRTIVTIIGIVLSVALLTAVASMFFSAKESLIKFEKERNGDYHWEFRDVPYQNISEFTQNRKIETVNIVKSLGYDYLEGGRNEHKPYINVRAYNKAAMENLAINLMEGRLPENENEIIISQHTDTNGGVKLNIGEKITLNLGDRVIDGEKLNQNNPYQPEGNEEIRNRTEHKYTIVGIMERPDYKIEPHSAPGYTFITYINEEKINAGCVDLYVRYTKDGIKDYLKVTANILGVNEEVYTKLYGVEGDSLTSEERQELISKLGENKYGGSSNNYLVTLESGLIKDATMQGLAVAVGVVAIIIIFTSVFCIKNSFDISITEKTKQYGMLASVGATRKQIKRNVYYEALILGLIGTPIGILCGELAAYILIIVSSFLLGEALNTELVFSFSWLSILFSILLATITIYLSARKSAKRASKITPLVAIRNSEDIKIKSKKIKSPKVINKIFGVGGEIAYKNLKRSKKKYRTTVISIILCVASFVSVSSFVNLAFKVVNIEYQNREYNVSVGYEENGTDLSERLEQIYKLDTVKRYSTISSMGMLIETDKYSKDFLEIFPGYGTIYNESGNRESVEDTVMIYSVNKEEFSRYVESLGLKYENVKDKAILVNNIYIQKQEDNKNIQVEIPKYSYNVGDKIKGTIHMVGDIYNLKELKIDLEMEIAKLTTEVPFGINEFTGTARVIISEELSDKIYKQNVKNIYIDSSNGSKTQEDISQILKDVTTYGVSNFEEDAKIMNSVYTLIAIFLYGFMIVIALIGITNIFNTITTNMNLRKREFAMLQSIGITKKEFKRMIRLESIFYGTKALIIGIPIGCILSYIIFEALMSGDLRIKYTLPIGAILISIIAVLLLISTIMRYSISKINKHNIIDTIRNDNI